MLRFLGYLIATYAGGFIIGMPFGMLMSFVLARHLAPFSRWVVELKPQDPTRRTPSSMAGVQLRWTARALVGIGSAIGCGVAAALYQHYFGVGNMVVWQIVMMLCAASMWNFHILLALPALLGWLMTASLLKGF